MFFSLRYTSKNYSQNILFLKSHFTTEKFNIPFSNHQISFSKIVSQTKYSPLLMIVLNVLLKKAVHFWYGQPLFLSIAPFKPQQLVSVILIPLLRCGNLCRQTLREVAHQCLELVEQCSNSYLFIIRRYRDKSFF